MAYTPTPDTRSSLVVTKAFGYRGGTKRWSNRYHIDGPLAMTLTEFETVADLIVPDEKVIYPSSVTIVEVSFNDASSATLTNLHGDQTHVKTFADVGTLDTTGGDYSPGDCALVLRYGTDARSVKNHMIYLFNYFHGVLHSAGDPIDDPLVQQVNAINEYGDDWLAGYNDGTQVRKRCGPRGAVAQNRTVIPYIRHRDFPT